ncbi:glycoside hydrolase family 5 protein [Dentipellis sp. KUC8613]|nr:glycoside hydrolase family 5 protein [Dentipellis sp. KUC8613]
MRLLQSLTCALSLAYAASAANSFAGSNLYYAAGLSASQRSTLLGAMQNAGMKVIRVWMDAESTSSTKNTPITSYPALEPNSIGTYDPTVLNLLDTFMVDAHAHGIKVLISMHSWNALSGGDVYGKLYGTGYFYEWANATSQFDNRLRYILNHQHSTLGKPWKELSDYIFAFEAENESMIGKGQSYIEAHQSWQCDRATTIKNALGANSGILVTTGGESWLDESVQDGWLDCAALDVVAIHAYGTGDLTTSAIQPYISRAQAAGKKLLFQEWCVAVPRPRAYVRAPSDTAAGDARRRGACYFTTPNNNCSTGSALPEATRNGNIQAFARQITAAGVPWMYWQVLPNDDPHYGSDYEVGVGESGFTALSAVAQEASKAQAAFDYSQYLL